jgi:hypothetical protein
MPVRWLVVPLALSVALVAGCGISEDSPVDRPTEPIAGNWTGTLQQKGLKPFRIAVRIAANGGGDVAYTGIECGGHWRLASDVPSVPAPGYAFKEEITEGAGGNCKGTGTVIIRPDPPPAPNVLGYEFTGGGVASKGTLHKTDAAGLKPVFDEAGVTPP